MSYRQLRFEPPSGSTSVLLIRHGEAAELEVDSLFPETDGYSDPPLHQAGIEQAELIADRLADEELAAVYISSLRRTRDTALPLARRRGLPITVEAGFREVHLGDWEGSFRRHVKDRDPLFLRVLTEDRWDLIPGAEPTENLSKRVKAAIDRVAAAHPDQTVAVFTHGGVIGEVLSQASSSRRLAFTGADNGSISRVVVAGSRIFIRGFNDTSHLAVAATPQT